MNIERIMILRGEVGVNSENNNKDHDPTMNLLKRNIQVHALDNCFLRSENQTSLGKRRRGSDEDDPKMSPTDIQEE